ncbi:MAG TPA: hypothetical protein VFQ92_21755 [Blastocatellia bacterium]|nr:hypothetical protein [Blastocatellia bacterium]
MIELRLYNRALVGAALALLAWASPAICLQAARDQRPSEALQPQEPATRLEKLMLRKSVLVVKEAHIIGAVPGLEGTEVRIEALALTVPAERERVFGVRLVRAAPRREAAELSALVDFDELASFKEALDYMLRAATEAKPPDESSAGGAVSTTEFTILTRGGVKAALVQTGRQFTGLVRVGRAGEEGEVSFGIGALGRLRALLSQARDRLVALGAK